MSPSRACTGQRAPVQAAIGGKGCLPNTFGLERGDVKLPARARRPGHESLNGMRSRAFSANEVFEVVGEITDVEVIARGPGVRVLSYLRKAMAERGGGSRKAWRPCACRTGRFARS